jgi:hypothetical protein
MDEVTKGGNALGVLPLLIYGSCRSNPIQKKVAGRSPAMGFIFLFLAG